MTPPANRGRKPSAGRSGSSRGGSGGGRPKPSGKRNQGRPRSGSNTGTKRARQQGLGGDQVEGRQAVRELLVAGRRRVREVVVSTDRRDAPVLDDILMLAQQMNVPVRELGRAKLDALARTESHQGVVATAAPLQEIELAELLEHPDGQPLVIAADGITDPGNLGAILRTAECAGVDGVILPRHRAVHLTPSATKAAAGAIEYLRFAVVGGLPAALGQAADAGAVVIGLDMGGDTSLFDLPPVDRPVVLVVGAEGRGLGRLVRQRCDVVASIPMAGNTESLNASVAAALGIYEVIRHR